MLISLIYLIKDSKGFVNNLDAIKKNVAGIDYPKDQFELLFMVNDKGVNKKVNGPPMARVFYRNEAGRNDLLRGIAFAYGYAIIIGDETMRLQPDVLNKISQGQGGIFFYRPTEDAKYLPGLTFKQRLSIAWRFLTK